eukprot:GHVS01025818.1.p2 GENE.GHVS01025818.1~~GHVS01025818.1.p2  ORF type:complete len:330 (-),score=99.87 GHVS01025818.1:2044-3033(-)
MREEEALQEKDERRKDDIERNEKPKEMKVWRRRRRCESEEEDEEEVAEVAADNNIKEPSNKTAELKSSSCSSSSSTGSTTCPAVDSVSSPSSSSPSAQVPAVLSVAPTATTLSLRVHRVKQTQQQRQRRHGLSSSVLNPHDLQKKALEEAQQLEDLGTVEDEGEVGYGLLQKQFTSNGGFSVGKSSHSVDKHLEAFLEERLGPKNVPVEPTPLSRIAEREADLYKVPLHLQFKDNLSEEADKMNWVTGLVEVPLSLESKLRNIEATEKAKRELLKLGKTSLDDTADHNSIESIKARAFGSRFLTVQKPAGSMAASDDAALDRFRKKMKK